MFQASNFKARESLNMQYSQIKGASSINDVSIGFGKGWVVFAVLSAMASAFSFYQDFNKSLGMVVTILIVIVLAVALESFKHLSIRGMFSSMNFMSKTLMTFVAIGLIMVSFYTHYKSIKTFQRNLVTDDLKSEIKYQRDLQKVQNSQISSILKSNAEFAKAINNGSSLDDKISSNSVRSNNSLISTLQHLAANNNMNNTNLLLKESRETAQTTASAILVIFIMVEIMALFSILSKIIVVDNVSGNVKEFFNIMDKLEELESNTYKTLGFQQMQQSKEKIKVVQSQQQREHKQEMYQIAKERVYENDLTKQDKMVKKRKVQKTKAKIKERSELPLEKYDSSERELLEALWNHGKVKKGEKLISRRKVLKEVGTLKGKGGVLTNLYNKLVRDGHIEFNVCYMAKANLNVVLEERK